MIAQATRTTRPRNGRKTATGNGNAKGCQPIEARKTLGFRILEILHEAGCYSSHNAMSVAEIARLTDGDVVDTECALTRLANSDFCVVPAFDRSYFMFAAKFEAYYIETDGKRLAAIAEDMQRFAANVIRSSYHYADHAAEMSSAMVPWDDRDIDPNFAIEAAGDDKTDQSIDAG